MEVLYTLILDIAFCVVVATPFILADLLYRAWPYIWPKIKYAIGFVIVTIESIYNIL